MLKTFRESMKGGYKVKAHSNNPQNLRHVNAHLNLEHLNHLQNVMCVWNTLQKWFLIFKNVMYVEAQLGCLQNVMHVKT